MEREGNPAVSGPLLASGLHGGQSANGAALLRKRKQGHVLHTDRLFDVVV